LSIMRQRIVPLEMDHLVHELSVVVCPGELTIESSVFAVQVRLCTLTMTILDELVHKCIICKIV
jgi:hypothetical protein